MTSVRTSAVATPSQVYERSKWQRRYATTTRRRRLDQWRILVAEPSVLEYIDGDATVFERSPLERLSADGELGAYQHHGYWHGMDTLWDKILLNDLWDGGQAPWKTWKE